MADLTRSVFVSIIPISRQAGGDRHNRSATFNPPSGSVSWRSRFGSAERLHFHFYHGELPAGELRTHRQRTSEGTLELLAAL